MQGKHLITLEFPLEVFSARRASPDEFGRDLRLSAALHWYQRGEISQEKAAQIAGLNRAEFIRALAREGIDTFQVDLDDLRKELARG